MKKAAAVLALVLASIALVACGSSGSTTTTTQSSAGNGAGTGTTGSTVAAKGSETLKLSTDPNGQLKYTTDTLTAKAGNVTIDLNNPQALTHDVAVENSSGTVIGKSDLVAQGSASVTLKNLKPGTYTYFCTVPGHKDAGMQGTLTVK